MNNLELFWTMLLLTLKCTALDFLFLNKMVISYLFLIEFLDYDIALELFAANEIRCLAPLFVGKMNEVINYDLIFDSTLPEIFGLPALPKGNERTI